MTKIHKIVISYDLKKHETIFFFKRVASRLNKCKAFLNALARNKQNVKN